MAKLTTEETCDRFKVGPRTPENWARNGFIHTFIDQNKVIRYDTDEIEVGFQKYGPRKMRDGRKKFGRPVIPIVVAEGGDAE
jgi:predicted site-specific integrase-resolvase